MDTALFRKKSQLEPGWKRLAPYGISLGGTVVSALLTLLLVRYAEQGVFALFFAAVFLSARYGGTSAGILTTFLTTVVAASVILPKLSDFKLLDRELVPLTLYVLVSALTVATLGKLKRTTDTLRAKEAHLSDFVENAIVGMDWVADDGRILWANKAELELLGYAAPDYIGHNVREFHADPKVAEDFLGRLARHETFKDMEVQLRARDGSIKTVLVNSNVLRRDGIYVRARCFLQDVTARKAAERALAENEVKFRAVFEKSLDAIGVSHKRRHAFVNPAFVTLFKLNSAEEVIGQPVLDLFPPGNRHMVADNIARRESGEQSEARYETRGLRPDGTEFDLEVDASVFELQGERYTLAILRDISARKQAEVEIENRARQQEVVAGLGQLALMENDLTTLTSAAVRLCHQTLAADFCYFLEVLPDGQTVSLRSGAGWQMQGPSPQRTVVTGEAHYALEYNQPVVIEDAATERRFELSEFLRAHSVTSGACLGIHGRARPLGILGVFQAEPRRFTRMELQFLQSVANVLTAALERQHAEAALREREYLLRRVLDTNPNFILVKDAAGTILLANEALAAAYRATVPALIGRSHLDLHQQFKMDLGEVAQWLSDDQEVIASGRPKLLVEPFTHRDGTVHWYRTNKLPFALGDKQQCVLIISEDITERKNARDELSKLNAELERRVAQRTAQLEVANKELESFSYSISHDLRAPLRAIYGFSQIITEEYRHQLDPEGVRLLEVISANTRRMGQLIDDLLAFSKVTRTEVAHAPVDMTALAREVVQDLTVLEPGRSQQIQLAELPPIKGDRALLQQVLVNLVGNALKFTRQAPAPAIEIGATAGENEVIYYVRDNGVGFDMKYAGKLFQVFQRLHRAEDFEGTGVGLAITQQIVNRHGGRIWAESTVNSGATFSFALPVEL